MFSLPHLEEIFKTMYFSKGCKMDLSFFLQRKVFTCIMFFCVKREGWDFNSPPILYCIVPTVAEGTLI